MGKNLTLETLASKGINDSSVSGATIKDALDSLNTQTIKMKNMPIGTTIYRPVSASPAGMVDPEILSEFVDAIPYYINLGSTNPLGLYTRLQHWIALGANAGLISVSNSPTMLRGAVSFNPTTDRFSVYNSGNSVFQTTNTGVDTFVNYDFDGFIRTGVVLDSPYFYQDDTTGEVVIMCTEVLYAYSANGVDFTLHKSPIHTTGPLAGLHMRLDYPMISNGRLIFYAITAQRTVYTDNKIDYILSSGDDLVTITAQIKKIAPNILMINASTKMSCSFNNGATWTTMSMPASSTQFERYRVATNGSIYVLVANAGAYYSTALNTGWTLISGIPSGKTVEYVNGLFFIFTFSSGTNNVWTSPDGINWTNQITPTILGSTVLYVNNLFMIVGESSIITSPDGVNWTTSFGVGIGTYKCPRHARVAAGTSKMAFVASSTVLYVYNAGTWTTITATQQRTNIFRTTLINQQNLLLRYI